MIITTEPNLLNCDNAYIRKQYMHKKNNKSRNNDIRRTVMNTRINKTE